jgi:hypothetical protein
VQKVEAARAEPDEQDAEQIADAATGTRCLHEQRNPEAD